MGKGQIRARMRRLAANSLGISHAGLLDPATGLLLDSLSEEVYKIGGEIERSEQRILEKLASMLAPDIETLAHPAHCILHACPPSGTCELATKTCFVYHDRKKQQDHSFYPACEVTLYAGTVSHFIHNGLACHIEKDLTKTLLARQQQGSHGENSFWLGLDLDDSIDNINGMSFYVDLPDAYIKAGYLNLLPFTAWSVGKEALVMGKGIPAKEKLCKGTTLGLFAGYSPLNQINRSVAGQYNPHFLTVRGDCRIAGRKACFPEELAADLPGHFKARMEKPLLWIKVECPDSFTPDIIESLQVGINAFPVLNKELVSVVTEVSKTVPVIPLDTESGQSFLAIQSVVDSSGKPYHDVPTSSPDNGIYTLRRGGIERFGRRDARDYLAGTVDELAGEALSLSGSATSAEAKNIEYALKVLLDDLKEKQARRTEWEETKNYLLLDPANEHEIFFIDYWVTRGKEANRIGAGENFAVQSELPVIPSSVYSLSMSQGGEFAPLGEKRQKLYKKSLAHHVLLVSQEDIRTFCLDRFKGVVGAVEVRKGFMESPNPKLGFVETTDVYLTLLEEEKACIHEKDREGFLQALKENSPGTYNYRVFINQ